MLKAYAITVTVIMVVSMFLLSDGLQQYLQKQEQLNWCEAQLEFFIKKI